MFELKPRCEKNIVRGILYKDGKILVLKNAKSGKYVLPGCVMGNDETIETTFKKAAKEEIGLENVNLGSFINVWSFTEEKNKIDYHYSVLDFEFSTNEKMIKFNNKYLEIKWFGESEIDNEAMDDGQKKTLHKYFSLRNKNIINR